MPNLSSIILAAFFFVHTQMDIKGIPMPVVIETGREYKVDTIYSTITVPLNWEGDCYSQRILIKYMAEYFNTFLNGNQKKSETKIKQVENSWVCVQ